MASKKKVIRFTALILLCLPLLVMASGAAIEERINGTVIRSLKSDHRHFKRRITELEEQAKEVACFTGELQDRVLILNSKAEEWGEVISRIESRDRRSLDFLIQGAFAVFVSVLALIIGFIIKELKSGRRSIEHVDRARYRDQGPGGNGRGRGCLPGIYSENNHVDIQQPTDQDEP